MSPFQGSSSSSPVTSLWVSLMKWSSSCCPPVSVGPASLHRPHDSASGIPRLKSIWRLSTPCPASPCRRARKASRLPSCRPTRAEPGERRRRMNSRPRRQAPAWARRSPRRSRAARPTTSASMTRWPVLAEEPGGRAWSGGRLRDLGRVVAQAGAEHRLRDGAELHSPGLRPGSASPRRRGSGRPGSCPSRSWTPTRRFRITANHSRVAHGIRKRDRHQRAPDVPLLHDRKSRPMARRRTRNGSAGRRRV